MDLITKILLESYLYHSIADTDIYNTTNKVLPKQIKKKTYFIASKFGIEKVYQAKTGTCYFYIFNPYNHFIYKVRISDHAPFKKDPYYTTIELNYNDSVNTMIKKIQKQVFKSNKIFESKLNEIKLDKTSIKDIDDDFEEDSFQNKLLLSEYKGLKFYHLGKKIDIKRRNHLVIYKKDEIVGSLELEKFESIVKVKYIFINSKFRGTGISETIYEFLINFFGGVFSDAHQTLGSKKIWLQLAKKFTVLAYFKPYYYKTYIQNNEIKSSIPVYGNINTILVCFKKLPKNIKILN